MSWLKIEHHACLLVDDGQTWPNLKKELAGHDFIYHRFESLGIKESRQLRPEQAGAPIIGERRFIVLHFGSATPEAQQALLKVVEEPALGTTWFFITPAPQELLATFLSRVWRAELVENTKKVKNEGALTFRQASSSERLALIEKLVKKEEKRTLAIELVDDIAAWSRAELDFTKLTPEWRLALKELAQVRTYLSDKAATVRLLLEHLALVWPIGYNIGNEKGS